MNRRLVFTRGTMTVWLPVWKKMRDLGNTLIVVEHDRTMRSWLSDWRPWSVSLVEIVAGKNAKRVARNSPSQDSIYRKNARFRYRQSVALAMIALSKWQGAREATCKISLLSLPIREIHCGDRVSGSGSLPWLASSKRLCTKSSQFVSLVV